MAQTLGYYGTLIVLTCWCGMKHAVPEDLRNFQLRQHNDGVKDVVSIYCPLGHQHIPSGEGRAAKLAREKQAAEELASRRLAALDQEKASRKAVERQAAAFKGQATRARKRAAAQLCPVEGCHRSFVQVRRHLTAKHPDYVPNEVT